MWPSILKHFFHLSIYQASTWVIASCYLCNSYTLSLHFKIARVLFNIWSESFTLTPSVSDFHKTLLWLICSSIGVPGNWCPHKLPPGRSILPLMFVMFLASDAGGRPLFLFPPTLPWRTVDIKSVLSLRIACATFYSFLRCMSTRSLRVVHNSFSMLSFERLSVHLTLGSLR